MSITYYLTFDGMTQRDVVRLGVRSIAVKFFERCPARSALEWATRLVAERSEGAFPYHVEVAETADRVQAAGKDCGGLF